MSPPTPSKLLRAAAILDMPVETLRERLGAPPTSDHTPPVDMTQVSGQQRDIMNTMLAQSVEEQCTQVDDLPHNQAQTEFTSSHAGNLDLDTRLSPKSFSADNLTFPLIGNLEEDAPDGPDIENMMYGIGEGLHINLSQPSPFHTTLESSSRDRSRGTDIDIEWSSSEFLSVPTVEASRESTRRASMSTTSSLVILTPSSSANSPLQHQESTPSLFIPTPSSSGDSVYSSDTQSLTMGVLEPFVAPKEAAMFGPCSKIWNIPPVS